MTGQGGLSEEQRAAVLAQVAERRRRNDELVAERGLLDPERIAASLVEGEGRRRTARVERAGRLDLGGS